MSTPLRTYLVTGANRGIGLSICRSLLATTLSTTGVTAPRDPIRLIATSRSGDDLPLTPGHENDEIHYRKLDISSPNSITSLAASLPTDDNNESRLDVLINNAGINLDAQYTHANARKTLETNYHGTRTMCLTFLPHLRTTTTRANPSRIVNVSSIASQLNAYPATLQSTFRSASTTLTLPALSHLASTYLTSVQDSSESTAGFVGPGRSYSFSKALVNALTMILARENPEVLVNCCCPGWVGTEMGKLVGRAPKTEEEGARVVVRVARGDVGGRTGVFWANESVRGRGEGDVREW